MVEALKFTKSNNFWGSALDPAGGGELKALPSPLAGG